MRQIELVKTTKLATATRRTMLKAALWALLAGTATFGVPSPPAEAATPANTLVIAKNIDDLITLDPAEVYELTGGEVVNNLYDRLLTFDPSDFTTLIGGAVELWKSPTTRCSTPSRSAMGSSSLPDAR